jgi:hypothetical protein
MTTAGGPECARCGSDLADMHLTVLGMERDVEVTDGKFILSPFAIEEPDSIQIEAVCKDCGHARYIPQHLWEWA